MRRREILGATLSWPLWSSATMAATAVRPLTAGTGALDVAGQSRLPVWAYDGQAPGPVLRFRRGDMLDLELINHLPEATTIHWHGLRPPNSMDGVPDLTQAPVPPGGRFRYRFPLQDAGTFWYHPHLGTPEQVERGLAGALIVEDDEPPLADAEAVWLLDDWRIDADGRIAEDFYSFRDVAHAGRLGQHLTVNGELGGRQHLQTGQRLRLRLINAANARIFALSLEGLPAWLIARDGVPAERAVPWDGPLLLGPGMRADLMIDAERAGQFALVDRFGRGERTLGVLDVSGRSADSGRPAPQPAAFDPLPEPDLDKALVHEMVLGGGMMSRSGWPQESSRDREARQRRRQQGSREADPAWTVNGQAHMRHLMMHPPEFSVPKGQSVRLVYDNRTAWWHPMHLHGHHFRELSRNGQPVAGQPWRDTVLLAPNDRVEVAFVADNPGHWLIHCHVLEHHAGGMGTVFQVNA